MEIKYYNIINIYQSISITIYIILYLLFVTPIAIKLFDYEHKKSSILYTVICLDGYYKHIFIFICACFCCSINFIILHYIDYKIFEEVIYDIKYTLTYIYDNMFIMFYDFNTFRIIYIDIVIKSQLTAIIMIIFTFIYTPLIGMTFIISAYISYKIIYRKKVYFKTLHSIIDNYFYSCIFFAIVFCGIPIVIYKYYFEYILEKYYIDDSIKKYISSYLINKSCDIFL